MILFILFWLSKNFVQINQCFYLLESDDSDFEDDDLLMDNKPSPSLTEDPEGESLVWGFNSSASDRCG